MQKRVEEYRTLIESLPAPGGGGAHQSLFVAGCLGYRAGRKVAEIVADVTAALPRGTRDVSAMEIEQGVEAGFAEATGKKKREDRGCPPRIRPGMLAELIAKGRGVTADDISARSPVPVTWPEVETGVLVLDALYGDDEHIFIGDDAWAGIVGQTIRTKAEWVAALRQRGATPWPKIMVNPITGRPAPKKSGVSQTLRGDGCVASHRFVVAEFDGLSIEEQLAFWYAAPHLPVSALIHSGKKSIHAWVRVDCADRGEWEARIEEELFPGFLAPLGLDAACKNASRLSRMPGHRRAETGVVQRCLYLAPEGRPVGL